MAVRGEKKNTAPDLDHGSNGFNIERSGRFSRAASWLLGIGTEFVEVPTLPKTEIFIRPDDQLIMPRYALTDSREEVLF